MKQVEAYNKIINVILCRKTKQNRGVPYLVFRSSPCPPRY